MIKYHNCFVCNKPIMVGEECFEIGCSLRDKELICSACHDSIVPFDTKAAYQELVGEDGDN